MATVERLLRTPGGLLWAIVGVGLGVVAAIEPVAWLLWLGWAYVGLLGLLEACHDRRDVTATPGARPPGCDAT